MYSMHRKYAMPVAVMKLAAAESENNDSATSYPLALLGDRVMSNVLTSTPRGETPSKSIQWAENAHADYNWKKSNPKDLILPKSRKILGALSLAAGATIGAMGVLSGGDATPSLVASAGLGLYGATRFLPSSEGSRIKDALTNNQELKSDEENDLYYGKFKKLRITS